MYNQQGKPPLELTSAERLTVLEQIIKRKDKDALHAWIDLNFSINVPRAAIVPGHDAPFDFIADYLFGDISFAVVLANRSGGKTMGFGILDTIMAFLQGSTEIATVGAIQFQAQKVYEYFKDFSSVYPFSDNITSFTQRESKMINGSKVQVLVGTMSGVNSPHPQLLFVDEIDLMPHAVLQQALSMPQSKHGVQSRTVLTSTRKFANGVMQRMMDEAPKRGHRLYQWNIWEVMEPLPKDDPELLQEIFDTFGAELPDNIDKCDGYYTWRDAINKKKSLDPETWEVEWLCSRPGLQGVIYGSSYSDENNLITNWTPQGKQGHIYLFEDFGYGEGHPDVVLFVWIPLTFDRLVVFDELYMVGHSTDQIYDAVQAKLQEYGYAVTDVRKKIRGNIDGWIPDYHGLTEIIDRKMRGAPMMDKVEDSDMYKVSNGIAVIKQFLTSDRLMITDKCINLRTEFLTYKKKKNLDGTYSKDPEKKNDHGPDALHYGIVRLFSALARRAFSSIMKEEREQKIIIKPKEDKVPNPFPSNGGDTILGDLTSKVF